jgi:hypothetical protein
VANAKTVERFFEFFIVNIRNKNTRRPYYKPSAVSPIGTLDHAQAMANHSSPRTTKLYDRRADEVSLDDTRGLGFETARKERHNRAAAMVRSSLL